MNPSAWQQAFLRAVQDKQYNIYSPTMIKALLKPAGDAASFKAMALKYFSKYESFCVSSTPGSRDDGSLTPRALWMALDTIQDDPVGPATIVTEQDAQIITEDGKALQAEA